MMIEVCPDLYIGNDLDYSQVAGREDWWIVHACKEPYHRRLLGYRSLGAPKGHAEYLVARRGKVLFLNLIDADDPAYVPKEIIDAGLDWIDLAFASGETVLVHCNQGESRSPSIGLLYLASRTEFISRASLGAAETEYRGLYPYYNPKPGIRGFLLQNWDWYTKPRDAGSI